MSHLTTYKSNVLKNCKKGILDKALRDLGLKVDYSIKEVKNTYITEPVDGCFIKDGKKISVGIKFEKSGKDTILTVAGDFFCTGLTEKTFIDNLSQNYKKYDVISKCKEMGWTVNKEDVFLDNKTKEIVINASRYAV